MPLALVESLERRAERLVTEVDGSQVVWRRWGSGRPLVLLHGGAGSWTHWVRNVGPLAAHHQVLAPDLPGFGESSLPPGAASAEDLAAVLAAAVDHVLPPPAPFALAGFSFGGIVAGLLARLHRRRVRRLVLVGAGGLGVPTGPGGPVLRVPPDAPPEQRADVHRRNLAALMIADPAHVDDLAVALDVANVARARFRLGSIPASDVLARALPDVAAPVIAVYGERDAYARGDVAARERAVRAAQPAAEFHVVEGAGHWVPYEAAEWLNAFLLERLAAPP